MVNLWFLAFGCMNGLKQIPTPLQSQVSSRKSPESIEYAIRSELYRLDGDWEKSKDAIDKAIRYTPKDPYLLWFAGESAYLSGEYGDMTAYWARAMPIIINQDLHLTPDFKSRLQQYSSQQ